jgi:thiamine-monophosphate kinase
MSNNSYSQFTDVSTLGEFGLIEALTGEIITRNATTIKSIGDDAAVIRNEQGVTLVSTDMLVEGIHFDLMYTPLKHLGYKAVVVNLSDIYAMNAVPTQITVSIAISNKYSLEAMKELYDGIYTACRMYNVDLVGGDTTSSPRGMVISVTALGQARPEEVVYRNGARPGDILCVTGDFGAAYLGLQILEREKQVYLAHPGVQPELEKSQYLIERQLKPEAQAGAIAYFKKAGIRPTSMIDVSDGLASDLMHICKQSGTGAFIEEGKVPMHPDAEQTALEFKLDPITCALHGGEDYELLFTIDEKDLEKIRFMPEVFIIGEISNPGDGIKLHTTGGNIHPITAQGWNHFRGNE